MAVKVEFDEVMLKVGVEIWVVTDVYPSIILFPCSEETSMNKVFGWRETWVMYLKLTHNEMVVRIYWLVLIVSSVVVQALMLIGTRFDPKVRAEQTIWPKVILKRIMIPPLILIGEFMVIFKEVGTRVLGLFRVAVAVNISGVRTRVVGLMALCSRKWVSLYMR